jgi:8-oxo-dGTP diphosphatase
MLLPANLKRPLVTVDVAIFAVVEGGLRTLLVKRPDRPAEPFPDAWALPGGFIDVEQDATLEACALRKLREKTGVRSPYLEQVGSWGSARRDPRGWSATHVYFALIAADSQTLVKGGNADDVAWIKLESRAVEKLAFDHTKLLAAALERLRSKVEYTSLPAFLMPETFTISELQGVYEVVLGRPLDKSAFRTRMLAAGVVEATGEMRPGSNRPAALYRLKTRETVYFPRPLSPRD